MSVMSDILSRFALGRHVPPEVRRHALVSKSSALVKTLKAAGAYSPYFGALARVASLTRRMGLRLTMAQCAAALWISLACLSGAVVAGGLSLGGLVPRPAVFEERYGGRERTSPDTAHDRKSARESAGDEAGGTKQKNETASPEKTDPSKAPGKTDYPNGTRDRKNALPGGNALETITPPKTADSDPGKDAAAPLGPVIGIGVFEAENLDGAQGALVAARLERDLARIRGGAGVVNVLDGNRNFGTRYLLVGSLSGLGGRFTLDARLVDTKYSSVIFAESVYGGSLEEIHRACGALAEKISERAQ